MIRNTLNQSMAKFLTDESGHIDNKHGFAIPWLGGALAGAAMFLAPSPAAAGCEQIPDYCGANLCSCERGTWPVTMHYIQIGTTCQAFAWDCIACGSCPPPP